MRLITHNLLVCNRKTCQAPGITNFPLKLVVQKWQDFDDESTMPCTRALMSKLAEKLDWEALKNTVRSVSIFTQFIWRHSKNDDYWPRICFIFIQLDWGFEVPDKFEDSMLDNEEFMTQFHNMLLRRQVQEGSLVCPSCDRVYEIKNAIPNMLLNEDEVWN